MCICLCVHMFVCACVAHKQLWVVHAVAETGVQEAAGVHEQLT